MVGIRLLGHRNLFRPTTDHLPAEDGDVLPACVVNNSGNKRAKARSSSASGFGGATGAQVSNAGSSIVTMPSIAVLQVTTSLPSYPPLLS